jgi:hypothetical protein
MKFLRKLIIFLYLATHLEPIIEICQLKFYFSTSSELGPFFATTVICICGNHIFQVQKMKKFVPKKIAWFISMSLHQCFLFVCAKIYQNEKNKNKKEYSVTIFSFSIKKPQLLKTKSFDFFWATFGF